MGNHPLKSLKKFRESQQLTQRELGKLLGASRTTIARWETGTRSVDRKRLQAVSLKTGIHPKELRPDLAKLLGTD